MTRRTLVDTNLIVRHLVQGHEKHAKIAGKLFEACGRGDLTIVILPPVLAECVFVLESFYEQTREDIAFALGALISSPGIEIADLEIHLDAMRRYQKTSIHYVDCLVAATAAAKDAFVATFDLDFRKFGDVRLEI